MQFGEGSVLPEWDISLKKRKEITKERAIRKKKGEKNSIAPSELHGWKGNPNFIF